MSLLGSEQVEKRKLLFKTRLSVGEEETSSKVKKLKESQRQCHHRGHLFILNCCIVVKIAAVCVRPSLLPGLFSTYQVTG